jgi:predicted GNAT superfamily acetyltransferase
VKRAVGKRPASPAAKSSGAVQVRRCHGLAEFAACLEVERAVWASADIDMVPLPLFVVAAETGGEVLGAFDGDRVVGFTLAFTGFRRRPFLHSHMTAVLESHRDAGIGRKLKLFQRQDVLARSIDLVEWTFDPLELKNAHFNFRLGAIARRYLPNVYGITTSPLHAGLPTDRLVAEWWLKSPRVRSCVSASPTGKPATRRRRLSKKTARIRIPGELAAFRRNQPDEALRLQSEVRLEFEHWFGLGYAATAVEIDARGGTYSLEPWPRGEKHAPA